MNKERAINILLEHAKRSIDNNDDAYAINKDALTAAILFLEHDRDKNKVDANIEVKGVSFNIRKGA
jgi:hypothetical protein